MARRAISPSAMAKLAYFFLFLKNFPRKKFPMVQTNHQALGNIPALDSLYLLWVAFLWLWVVIRVPSG